MERLTVENESQGEACGAMDGKLRDAVERWNLTGIRPVYGNCGKAVYFAFSEKFGNVVLKMNCNGEEFKGEYGALKEFEGNVFCRVYDYDASAGLLLEERILPGTALRNVADTDRRLRIFAEVFRQIPRREAKGFETYLEWLNRAYAYCRRGEVSSVIAENMGKALEIGKEVFGKYPERVLLHGDLHHDNILLGPEGGYKIIDPKGIIGPAIFDLPRFVMNELGDRGGEAGAEHIRYVISGFAEDLGYEREDIEKLFFMEVTLGAVWCLEDGEKVDWEDIHAAAEIYRW